MEIKCKPRLDYKHRQEAMELAANLDPEDLAHLAVFYRTLAEELADLCAEAYESLKSVTSYMRYEGLKLENSVVLRLWLTLRRLRGESS